MSGGLDSGRESAALEAFAVELGEFFVADDDGGFTVGVGLEHDLRRARDFKRGHSTDECDDDVIRRVYVVVVEDDAVGRRDAVAEFCVAFDACAGEGWGLHWEY